MAAATPCVCATLRRVTRAVTATYDAALAPCGLRITQFAVLRTLLRTGPAPVTRLAAELALDRSTMGRNLDPLERRGLVRIGRGRDQRERVAAITPEGEAAVATAMPFWQQAQTRLTAAIPPDTIDSLANRLGARL